MESDALLQVVQEMQASLRKLEAQILAHHGVDRAQDSQNVSLKAERLALGDEWDSETQGVEQQDYQPAAQNQREDNAEAIKEIHLPAVTSDLKKPQTKFYEPQGYFLGSRVQESRPLVDDEDFPGDMKNLLLMSLKEIQVQQIRVFAGTSTGGLFPLPTHDQDWHYCKLKATHQDQSSMICR